MSLRKPRPDIISLLCNPVRIHNCSDGAELVYLEKKRNVLDLQDSPGTFLEVQEPNSSRSWERALPAHELEVLTEVGSLPLLDCEASVTAIYMSPSLSTSTSVM